MGVTIHFEGKLRSKVDFERVMAKARDFAIENEMDYHYFNEPLKRLGRIKDEQEWDYEGPTRGLKIQPHENSDPLWIEFDENNFIQEFCKTQFAGIEVHILIINFLKQIQPHFSKFVIVDEGEYWDSGDPDDLQEYFDNYFVEAEKAKEEHPDLNGPFRLEDGRIIDLMRDS